MLSCPCFWCNGGEPPADDEVNCPSVDVCGWCGDGECDGIACIARLDPDDQSDHEEIELLHAHLRAGRVFLQSTHVLARQENRWTQRAGGAENGATDA
jgi:hypothetical protein